MYAFNLCIAFNLCKYNNCSFNDKKQCLIDQYNRYEYTNNHPFNKLNNVKVQGEYTQTENIADNGGIRAAYKAFGE